jgi:type IV secretory pathway ATPase VirB11/archaellum biosynthesis ATPase
MEKFFNNAGPQQPANHYTLDPLQRVNLEELQDLIAQQRYFVLHAPRQTGKTTVLYALMHHVNRHVRPVAAGSVHVWQVFENRS